MKSLFKNSVYNLFYKLFSLIFPLISSAYLSRILNPLGVGKVVYAQNIASYFITLAALGVSSYGIREIGKVQKNQAKYSKVFFELITITLLSTCVCSVVYYLGVIRFVNVDEKNLYFIIGIQLLLGAFNVDWFYQGMEEYKYITARSFAIKVLTMIAMFLFVKSSADVLSYAFLSSIALAGNNLINIIHIRKYIVFVKLFTLELRKHLKPLIVLLSTGIAVELYTKLDITSLGILAGIVSVGYYSYATKITSIVVNLAASLSVILLPRLSFYHQKGLLEELEKTVDNAQKAILLISIPATIGLILLSDEIVFVLFGSSFSLASLTVKILSILVIVKSIGNLYGVQVLITFGGEKILFLTTLIGAISNVFLNIILIPILGHNGAAIASIISEMCVCITQVYFSSKFIKLKLDWSYIIKLLISIIFMVFGVLVVKQIVVLRTLKLILSIIVGALLYCACNIVLRNDVILFLIGKIKFLKK